MSNIADLTASSRLAPSWGPEKEKDYTFRAFRMDVIMWQAATDIDITKQGPSLVLRLTGGARELMREINPDLIINGETRYDAAGNITDNIAGVNYILQVLQARFAPLEQEIQLCAISDLFTFTRSAGENTDDLLTRYDIIRSRAENLGQARFPIVARAWILLNAMKIPKEKWANYLQQFLGRLPTTEEEYAAFLLQIRREGHFYDKGGDRSKSLQQPFFVNHNTAGTEGAYWGSMSSAPAPGWHDQGQSSYFQDDDDYSSCCSLDEQDLIWHDLDDYNDNDAGEQLYLAHRFAKRRWRSYTGHGGKGSHRRSKGGGKIRGKGKYQSKGSYFGGSKGGKKGGNPIGRDGQQMRCSICNSTQHFRANCPNNTSSGHASGTATALYQTEQQPRDTAAAAAEQHHQNYLILPRPPQQTLPRDAMEDESSWIALDFQTEGGSNSAFAVFSGSCAYHTAVRLKNVESLLVDTGSCKNLSGDIWAKRVEDAGHAAGQGSRHSKLERPFPVDGVGSGSSQVEDVCELPIALPNGHASKFVTNIIKNSEIPGLLGLNSMDEHHVLLDIRNNKFILVGKGGYKLQLSPGSSILPMQRAPTGHLMLPISDWTVVKRAESLPAFHSRQ